MKLTTMDEDLHIHEKLDDEPNDVGGLSARELKKKFDRAGVAIQEFLNGVHIPEEERAASEVLEQAKDYTDRKVFEVGAGDMAAAIYDPQRRRRDIFEYTDEKAREVKADTSNLGFIVCGTTDLTARSQGEPIVTKKVVPYKPVDPRGLFDEKTGEITVPEGANAVIVHLRIMWMRRPEMNSWCFVRIKANGETRAERRGPTKTDLSWIYETVVFAAEVKGGEKVTVEIEARQGQFAAEVRAYDMLAEFVL